MSITVAVISVLIGFVALIGGGEFLVRSSAKLAAAIGISPLVIGLTVVAFATSAPELAIVIQSAFAGKMDLAVGNAVGSNIFNVLLVLGMSAVVSPLVVTARVVRLDVPLMIGASVLLLLLSFDGRLSRWDGALLFTLLVIYIVWTIRESRKAVKVVKAEFAEQFGVKGRHHLSIQLAFLLAGLALLVVGAAFHCRRLCDDRNVAWCQ